MQNAKSPRNFSFKTSFLVRGSTCTNKNGICTESKWDSVYEGRFIVIKKKTSGAYVLKDRLREKLQYTIQEDQLKLVSDTNWSPNAVL